jgi:hypothetical protein
MNTSNTDLSNETEEGKIADFILAFRYCFEGKVKGAEYQPVSNEGPLLIKAGSEVYQVDNLANIKSFAREALTIHDQAMLIPLEKMLLLTEEIHLSQGFIASLINDFKNIRECEVLNCALNLSNNAGKSARIFWSCLYSMGEVDVYPKAIVAATRFLDIDILVDELVEFILADPQSLLTDMQDDCFKIVNFPVESEEDKESFYIYRIDPALWQ